MSSISESQTTPLVCRSLSSALGGSARRVVPGVQGTLLLEHPILSREYSSLLS